MIREEGEENMSTNQIQYNYEGRAVRRQQEEEVLAFGLRGPQ